jgi:phosphotriesterase-related protein
MASLTYMARLLRCFGASGIWSGLTRLWHADPVPEQVQTVLGSVPASGLGRTLMHEHIFVLTADVQQNYPQEWGDEDARVADAVGRLRELPGAGIGTIVDVTVIGQGRYIPRIQRIAQQVPGLNIVVATGCYTFDEVPLFFWGRPPHAAASPGGAARDVMADFFVRDITEGIAGTGVKAGMLKCAVDVKGLTRGVERVLRAVAQAQVRTGVPITIHTHAAGKHGPAILEVLRAEGADLSRVVLGHSGDSDDPDYLQSMAEAGLTLGMDRFGIDHLGSFHARSDLVAELCRRGLAGAMVLSHDCSCYIDWFAPGSLDNLRHWHYRHISQDVLPYLRERGVTDDQIDTMLERNPARILASPHPEPGAD